MLPLKVQSSRSEHLQGLLAQSRTLDVWMRSDVAGTRLWLGGNSPDELRFPRSSVVRIMGGIVGVNRATGVAANTATVELIVVTDAAGVSTLTTVPGVPVGYSVSKAVVGGEDVVSIVLPSVASTQYTGTFTVTHQGAAADTVTGDVNFATAGEVRSGIN